MIFSVPNSNLCFSIPDEWWEFCDCRDFHRKTDFYLYPPELDKYVEIVPIEEVVPPLRDVGIEPFKKHRLVAVLLGMESEMGVVPPIAVSRCEKGVYKYKVENGYHRFYASVALGFPRLPIIFGSMYLAKRSEIGGSLADSGSGQ